eukprot:TRINITY_DN6785_c0_g1_i3.p3 TRINITY_DN6785_c0_g1~~TRINITY_DN6785_c0_g1_i3.p3  ORF type:complete len:405 (-),score=45.97 TRINITY_DN6785_c0_g1_i3:2685-3899(-)
MTQRIETCKRLVVTGLAWQTSDEGFRQYFSYFGQLEQASVVRDVAGVSKGFGYVTFAYPQSVELVLRTAHVLDNRRIEVKMDPRATNNNRIFVAKIPGDVSETEFRNYFERFGRIQDAYMPKDRSKQSYRGIGFVTFEDSVTVDLVIRQQHQLGGCFVAVDRAIIKSDNVLPASPSASTEQLALNLASMNQNGNGLMLPNRGQALYFSGEDSALASPNSGSYNPYTTILQENQLVNLQNTQYPGQGLSPDYIPPLSPDPSYIQELLGGMQQQAAVPAQLLSPSSRTDISGVASPISPMSPISGIRIFVTKLTRDTTEQDVREYFQRFGYVLDVYLPKNKDNRREHRGFGFVTFETAMAVARIDAQGPHNIKGSTVVVDAALPRREALEVPEMSPGSPVNLAYFQ